VFFGGSLCFCFCWFTALGRSAWSLELPRNPAYC